MYKINQTLNNEKWLNNMENSPIDINNLSQENLSINPFMYTGSWKTDNGIEEMV